MMSINLLIMYQKYSTNFDQGILVNCNPTITNTYLFRLKMFAVNGVKQFRCRKQNQMFGGKDV